MNMIADTMPVLFISPITGKPSIMPIEMIAAYIPDATYLHLEEAAKIAAIRDDESATNLLLSIVLDEHDADYQRVITVPEGTSTNALTAETS